MIHTTHESPINNLKQVSNDLIVTGDKEQELHIYDLRKDLPVLIRPTIYDEAHVDYKIINSDHKLIKI